MASKKEPKEISKRSLDRIERLKELEKFGLAEYHLNVVLDKEVYKMFKTLSKGRHGSTMSGILSNFIREWVENELNQINRLKISSIAPDKDVINDIKMAKMADFAKAKVNPIVEDNTNLEAYKLFDEDSIPGMPKDDTDDDFLEMISKMDKDELNKLKSEIFLKKKNNDIKESS